MVGDPVSARPLHCHQCGHERLRLCRGSHILILPTMSDAKPTRSRSTAVFMEQATESISSTDLAMVQPISVTSQKLTNRKIHFPKREGTFRGCAGTYSERSSVFRGLSCCFGVVPVRAKNLTLLVPKGGKCDPKPMALRLEDRETNE